MTSFKLERHSLTMDLGMLENNPAPCYLTDGKGRILYFNPAMQALFGYGREEYIGKSITILEEDPEVPGSPLIGPPGEGKGSWQGEIMAVSSEGRIFPCQIAAMESLDPGDGSRITLGLVHDMSDHVETIHALKARTDLLGALASIASRISVYTDIQRLSREALQSLAYLFPIKAGFLLLIDEETGALCLKEGFNLPMKEYEQYHSDRSWDDCLEGQVVREKSPILIENISGDPQAVHYVPGSMSLGLVPLLTHESVIGVLSVTTAAPHRLDQADMEFLLALASQLGIYFENARLLERLRETNLQLVQQNQDLEELLSIISHDLRSPLATIGGYSSLLVKRGEELSPNERSRFARTIFRKTRETSERFDDLLAIFRLSAVQEEDELRPFPVRGILETALEDSAPAEVRKAFTVILPENLPRLVGYPHHLTHIFTNLLSNAFKFIGQQENPKITIGCEKVETPEGVVQRFTVTDNGMGIPQDYIQGIFKPFFRVPTGDEVPGSGVGLAAVHRIVRNHRGSLEVESTVGEGTAFTFTLPWKEIDEKVPGA